MAKRALIYNIIAFLAIAVFWTLWDLIYVFRGQTGYNVYVDTLLQFGLPVTFFIVNILAFKEIDTPKRVLVSIVCTAIGCGVVLLALLYLGIRFHLSIGGSL